MKKVMAVLLSMMCAACAPVATKVSVPDMAKSDALSVRDVRPDSEKDRKLFSLLVTSKEYGIIREGDAGLSPSPVRLLQHQVFEKFDASGHLPKVDVYHFVVYENLKSKLRSNAMFGSIGGLLGGLAADAVATHVAMAKAGAVDEEAFDRASGDDEYQRALFTEAENPAREPVYIVYIDTDIGGERVLTRTVSLIKQHGDESSLATAVQSAITNHLGHYGAGVPVEEAASLAAPSPAVAGISAQGPPASTAVTSMAQGVANQLGCGAVKANGDSTFVAPCGSHGVLIDCDGGQCRPMHTVSIK